jgi:signal transduction histidine kinase
MLDRIEELVKSIREMSDNIAHDLKSPLTRIRGFAELALVQEENLEDYRAMAANTIEESDRLLDMINTMLVISKAEAGDTDFIFKKTDLSLMVNEACDLFGPLAEDKHIEFSRQVEDEIVLSGDIRMLQRAFSNLLDNAIKYTPEKGKISVQAAVKDHEAVITIKDTGTGIAPEYVEKIFERFYRAESSRTSSGTGLGLSFARTIVRRHNGDIRVSSRPGEGSVFSMTLPTNNFPVI